MFCIFPLGKVCVFVLISASLKTPLTKDGLLPMIIDGSLQQRGTARTWRRTKALKRGAPNVNRGQEGFSRAKFRCLECKKEFEAEANDSSKRCPECLGRYLELISGEMKRGKSWSAKSYSVR